jgi:nitrite reductase/ring-hydroxylating ferredoxin subunit
MGERIPLPFPIGWFCLGEAAELAPGELRRLHHFGQDLILWRGESGDIRVMDAFCPHLGAHLGVGGRVVGDTVRCPFHHWRFDGSGECVEIPYAKRIPPKARVASWPVLERNGLVFTWYAPDGRAPFFDIPEVPELGDDAWTAPVSRTWQVKTHPQEMAENTVDAVHFHYVHGTPYVPEMRAEIEGHVFHGQQGLTFKTPEGEKKGNVDIRCYGTGFGVTRFTGVIETLLVITGIPIDDELHQTTIRYIVKKIEGNDAATEGIAKAFISELARQYSEDIPIWENKKFLARPALCDGDGPIGLIRKYYAGFFPQTHDDSGSAASAAAS